MTTRTIGPFRAVTDKEGKVRVVKRAPRMAAGQRKKIEGKAARLSKAWAAKRRGKG
jgi:hypothetical protein